MEMQCAPNRVEKAAAEGITFDCRMVLGEVLNNLCTSGK